MEKNYVMKFGQIGQSIFYRVACDCTDPQCDITLDLEYDEDIKRVCLNMYKTLRASAHWDYTGRWGWFDWVRILLNKIKMCWTITTKGYIELSETFFLCEEKQIDDFINALHEGRKILLENRGKDNE